jgi:hypothetical protein
MLTDGSQQVVEGRELGPRLRVDGDRLVFGGYPFTQHQAPSSG